MCFAFAKILPFFSLVDNSRLENFECAFAFRLQFSANAQRKREHGTLGVPDGSAVDDWNIEGSKNSLANLTNCGSSGMRGIAVRKIAENYAPYACKLSSLAEV